jgi:type I restriction-modification system DNA methylase subunit
MIDASKGFMKDGPKNGFREQDIHRIVDTFTRKLGKVARACCVNDSVLTAKTQSAVDSITKLQPRRMTAIS